MVVISIREQGKTNLGFQASLVFERREYPVVITNPFTPQEEQQLEWYFKDYMVCPFSDEVRAQRAANSIRTYGERLFQQLFQDQQAYGEYYKLRGGLSQLQIEIIGNTPEFHALHWEALREPELSQPLAVDYLMVRKSSQFGSAVSGLMRPSSVINVLIVVARPGEEKDAGCRTVSRLLMEVIKNSQLRVNVELLRSGTYEALSRHLEYKGAGYYHTIHFDAPSSLMTYEQIQQRLQANRYSYEQCGRENLRPYSGVKAFLFLEGETKGKADPVEAEELADLLISKKIPVCILHNYQSRKQVQPLWGSQKPQEGGEEKDTDSHETSFSSRLMAAGIQVVVAMRYGVTVSTAKLMIEKVYTNLSHGKCIASAIHLCRRELFMNRSREAYFNKFIKLEDWLLPVVYSNQVVNFNLRQFTPEEEKYWKYWGGLYRFKQPEYGFVGRDLEILSIEKALKQNNILLLQGMGGVGKTTLLDYLREWWQTTHFALNVFYFGYDERAWTLKQILFEISKQIYKGFQPAQFQAMSETAVVEKLLTKLRSEPYVLILDNFESVVDQSLVIQNTLPEAERNKIKDFLERLVGGKSRIVIGSRSDEHWLQATTFKNNIYELQGLDEEARTELAGNILAQHVAAQRIEDICQDSDFQQLMNLLGGYPLAMEVLLPNLKEQSAQKILQELEATNVENIDIEEKTNNILNFVESYHINLSVKARSLLLFLAPFIGFFDHTVIPQYINQLQKLEQFKEYNFDKFDAVIQEAIQLGLLAQFDGNKNRILKIQPVFSYFLKTKIETIDKTIYEALKKGFKNHYQALADEYRALINSKDEEKQKSGKFFCEYEYENLYNVLQISLKNHESISTYFCLCKYLDSIDDDESSLKLTQAVCQALESYPSDFLESELGYEVALVLAKLGSYQLSEKQYQQARESYGRTLIILGNVEDKQKQLWRSESYHHLGIIAEQLGEYDEARRHYHQALQIKIKYGDSYSQAIVYHRLGSVAQKLREYEEAERSYHQALQIFAEYDERYSQAMIYRDLGIVAQELREHEEARRNYQQALHIFIEYDDRYSQAMVYRELGIIAQQIQEHDEARRNYQQALDIFTEYDDRYSLAITHQYLGSLCEQVGQYEEARANYHQALHIFAEYDDYYSLASTHHDLGIVAQALREYEEAKRNYNQALHIFIEYDDRYSLAITYQQMGSLAEEVGEYEEARRNYHQALQIYIEYDDLYSLATTYHELGIIAQELGEHEEAKRNYHQALEIFTEYSDREAHHPRGDRYSQAITYHQLGSLAEQMGEYEEARVNYHQALEIYIEHSDYRSLANTYHELGIVAEQVGEYEEARRNYHQALQIRIQYGDSYLQAKTYYRLGLLAGAQQDYTEAKANLQKALEVYVAYNDEYWAAIVREDLRRLNFN